MHGLTPVTSFYSRLLRPLALALALTAGLSGTRACIAGTLTDLDPVRKDLGADVGYQSSSSSMVILGTVERVKPREHWVEIFHDQPPTTLMTSEAFEASGGGSHRDYYFTDVTIKVSEFLQKPRNISSSLIFDLRVYSHGPDDLVLYNGQEINLEANFKPGDKVLLFLKRDRLPFQAMGGASGSGWVLTSQVFSRFSQLNSGEFLQNGDPKYGGGKKYTRNELMQIIKPSPPEKSWKGKSG